MPEGLAPNQHQPGSTLTKVANSVFDIDGRNGWWDGIGEFGAVRGPSLDRADSADLGNAVHKKQWSG